MTDLPIPNGFVSIAQQKGIQAPLLNILDQIQISIDTGEGDYTFLQLGQFIDLVSVIASTPQILQQIYTLMGTVLPNGQFALTSLVVAEGGGPYYSVDTQQLVIGSTSLKSGFSNSPVDIALQATLIHELYHAGNAVLAYNTEQSFYSSGISAINSGANLDDIIGQYPTFQLNQEVSAVSKEN